MEDEGTGSRKKKEGGGDKKGDGDSEGGGDYTGGPFCCFGFFRKAAIVVRYLTIKALPHCWLIVKIRSS